MADKEKFQEERKTGGPKMLRSGLGQQARRKKSLEEIQKEMRKKNLGVEFKKILRKADEKLSKVDKGFMKDSKNRDKIVESVIQNEPFEPVKISAASRREGASVFNKMAKGGRAGFKSGSKGCKLAMKGKGRAYGKNS
jgi:hypothetical protein